VPRNDRIIVYLYDRISQNNTLSVIARSAKRDEAIQKNKKTIRKNPNIQKYKLSTQVQLISYFLIAIF
jgi:hypothetical protein